MASVGACRADGAAVKVYVYAADPFPTINVSRPSFTVAILDVKGKVRPLGLNLTRSKTG